MAVERDETKRALSLCNCLRKPLNQMSSLHSHNSTSGFFFVIQFYYSKILIYLCLENQVKKFATNDSLRYLSLECLLYIS